MEQVIEHVRVVPSLPEQAQRLYDELRVPGEVLMDLPSPLKEIAAVWPALSPTTA